MTATTTRYTSVSGSPVKSFFVRMLTRDIELEDAILDLLDNCVDGILRTANVADGPKPYSGKYAEIEVSKDSFTISDNCGGIPWTLRDYAFRMGRADKRPDDGPTGAVGVYGIGMKRAIFKMGRDCLISSQNARDRYEVHIEPRWLDDDDDWDIPVKEVAKRRAQDGTTIVVHDLYDGIRQRFAEESLAFCAALERRVATHYAYILSKGFVVKINGASVEPRPTALIIGAPSDHDVAIHPYIFKTHDKGVDVFLAVGFTQAIPSAEEASSEDTERLYSSEQAGWTVLCNDRAVLFSDKSALTGWGEAGIPRYHTQFIAIAGIVEFRSADPRKLPTTTTKRGVDASAALYLNVKNKMREGMGYFTSFTYKWKGREPEARQHILSGTPVAFEDIKAKARTMTLARTKRTFPAGQQYRPRLPLPKRVQPSQRRISFLREADDVKAVARYLFGKDNVAASRVGEKCFDTFLSEVES